MLKYQEAERDIAEVLKREKIPMTVGELWETLSPKYVLCSVQRACKSLEKKEAIEFSIIDGKLKCYLIDESAVNGSSPPISRYQRASLEVQRVLRETGKPLVFEDICQQLCMQFSRTTIRYAVEQLHNQELVEIIMDSPSPILYKLSNKVIKGY